jgi:two-component system CheB/CheR fusion protein
VFLDSELRIKRYTSEARHLIKIIPTDVGRSIGDLVTNLVYADLQNDAAAVMRSLEFCVRDVRTTSGVWRLVRIVPYRTVDNMIEGLVVMFVDINKVKLAEEEAAHASRMAASIVATMRESLLVLDAEFTVVNANAAFYRNFALESVDVEGRVLFSIADGLWDVPALRQALGNLKSRDTVLRDFKLQHDFRQLGSRTLVINARRLEQPLREPGRFLLVMEDITTWENRHESSP